MRIHEPPWELMLLAGLACLGLGVASTQDAAIFAAIFAVEAAFVLLRLFTP